MSDNKTVVVPVEPTVGMYEAFAGKALTYPEWHEWTPKYQAMISAAPQAEQPQAQDEREEVYNPWRESLENCINGDNYLRASEYQSLIEELDDLYRLRAALAQKPEASAGKDAQERPWWVIELEKHWGAGETSHDTRRAAKVAVDRFSAQPADKLTEKERVDELTTHHHLGFLAGLSAADKP